jgi:hypothetical protein
MLLWDARVADEAAYEARIESAFDRADANASAGNLERALESLAVAEDLCGGLPDAYIRLRAHWISLLSPRAVVVRP